jgi:acetyltransferase-like isoleucine patch superfamily enzyme
MTVRKRSLKQHLQWLIRRHVFAMDVHPTAWIAATALIDRTYPLGIHIGADCVIGEEAVVLSHDLTRGLYVHTRVGEGTRIGARAILLPGISVGRNCIIEPGALVNRDMPDHHVASGNPATIAPRDAWPA